MNGVLTFAPVRRPKQHGPPVPCQLPGWLQAGVVLFLIFHGDALNRLTATTDALNITVTNTYDPVGNKLTVTDGKLQTTAFVYDGLNRNVRVTDPAGHATVLAYDALNKVQRTDALGQVTSYLYDARNRLTGVAYNSGAAANSPRNYS